MSKFVYQELHTSDPAGARKFYTEVFGWEFKDMEMGGSTYTMISADGVGIGGLMKAKSKAKAATKWVGYVGVPSAKRALNKAAKRGGKVVVPVTKVPGVGAFAMIADPAGRVVCGVGRSQKDGTHEGRQEDGTQESRQEDGGC